LPIRGEKTTTGEKNGHQGTTKAENALKELTRGGGGERE